MTLPKTTLVERLLTLKQKTAWSWETFAHEINRVMGGQGPVGTTLMRYANDQSRPRSTIVEQYLLQGIDRLQRELAEQALQEREAKGQKIKAAQQERETSYRALLELVPDAMFRISKDGIYLDYIPAKGFEPFVPVGEFLGKKATDVLPAEVAQQCMRYIKKALKTGETQTYDYTLPTGKTIKHFQARIVICGQEEVMGIVRDITEQKNLESMLINFYNEA